MENYLNYDPLNKHNAMVNVYWKQNSRLKSLFAVISLLLFCAGPALADPAKDSAVQHVRNLSALYQKKVLTEKKYLDTIDKTIQLFQSEGLHFSNEELLKLLTLYRQLIWDKKDSGKLRKAYYAMLSNQARMDGRNGEMLYYAERLSELQENIEQTPSVTSLSLIAGYYYSNMAYPKITALYNKHRKFLEKLPQMVTQHQFEKKEVMRSAELISTFLMGAYNAKDKVLVAEMSALRDRLVAAIQKVYSNDTEVLVRLRYTVLMADHQKARIDGTAADIWKNLVQFDSLLYDINMPEYLKSYAGFTIADKKALYFLDQKINDSAEHYIKVLYAMYGEKIEVPMNAYMVKKYESRLLYNRGFYKASEDTLVKSLIILEEAVANNTSEIDEIMYALTKVEEQQFLLADAAKKQKKSDQRFMLLVSGSILLLSGSILVFLLIRRRQMARFLNFKLNLARNIHDETNPALLYAKMLAKEQRMSQHLTEKGALEQHIDHTMELIRSLSKDLKSDQQLLVSDLVREVREMVEKISQLSDFKYTLQVAADGKRFLSHYQYTNIKAMLQECLSNSIKHAEFKEVYLSFETKVNMLYIVYKDDGKGWPANQPVQGIGLQNMQDRTSKLNGDIKIENNYPQGYQIRMSIKLS